jgi:hypothetical protein
MIIYLIVLTVTIFSWLLIDFFSFLYYAVV